MEDVFSTLFTTGVYLGEVSRAYYKTNNRWPANAHELVAFCEERDMTSLQDTDACTQFPNLDVDIYMFEDVRLYPQSDGKLKVEFALKEKHIVINRNDLKGSVSAGRATGSVIISPPDEDEPCDGDRAGTAAKQRAKSHVPFSTPKPDDGSTDARSR